MPGREIRLDVRGLEPCEPMDRILAQLASLPPGTRLHALLSREPVPLLPLLEQRSFQWQVAVLAPGRCELLIWRHDDAPAAPANGA